MFACWFCLGIAVQSGVGAWPQWPLGISERTNKMKKRTDEQTQNDWMDAWKESQASRVADIWLC